MIVILSITNLATTTALNAVENKIPNVSNLVKKKLTITKALLKLKKKKITDHFHHKYITTPEFNTLTAENLAAKLAQANLAIENDVDNFVNKTNFDDNLKNLN